MVKEITDSIIAILTLILDAKWKVFAFIILAVLGFSGSLIWDSKDVLIGIWSRKPAIVDVDKFAQVAPVLLKQFGAAGTILLTVDVDKNERTVAYFSTRSLGRYKEVEGYKGQFLASGSTAHDSNALASAKLITKLSFCDASSLPVTPFGAMRKREGLIVLCKAPVLDGDRLIGVVQLGFEKMPEDQNMVLEQLQIVAKDVKK